MNPVTACTPPEMASPFNNQLIRGRGFPSVVQLKRIVSAPSGRPAPTEAGNTAVLRTTVCA